MRKLALAAALWGLAALPAAAQDRVLLQLDWIPAGEHAACFAGAARGFWRDQGIDTLLTRGYGSGDTVTRVVAGTAQFGVADLGAVVAEFVGADAGLGYLIQTSMAFFKAPLAFGAVVILAMMGILLFQAVALAERILFPWSIGVQTGAPPAA